LYLCRFVCNNTNKLRLFFCAKHTQGCAFPITNLSTQVEHTTNGNGAGHGHADLSKVTAGMLLVTLGIIYGDIGTSPLYVFDEILKGHHISEQLVYGAISCIFWTLTFQTTIKYVLLTLNADNKGEGGILALYAIVRKRKKWLLFPAILGASTLLADGLITPPISVSSAVEGVELLHLQFPDWIPEHINTVPIVCVILMGLFMFQRFGTTVVGALFGPIMMLWFSMLAVLGISQIVAHPQIFAALNPMYAYDLLVNGTSGFWVLGSVFLCTTGAEALYSDLGHCGKQNIRVSWIFVKCCLVLNYLGQGAFLMTMDGQVFASKVFYGIVPPGFLVFAIPIATMATIIASQALITGSFTLIAEAMRLNLWLKHKVIYTSDSLGQIYVPAINTFLAIGCVLVTMYFQKSENMAAAYGLSITLTMLMTSVLISFYMWKQKFPMIMVLGYALVHGTIELSFLVANLSKFPEGGYVTLMIAGVIAIVMYTMHRGRQIRNKFLEFVDIRKYITDIRKLSNDMSVPKYATHLVYLTKANSVYEVENKVIHSIFENKPKRADVYWLIHVDSMDVPQQCDYKITVLAEDDLVRVDFRIGYRTEQQIGVMFKKVLEEVVSQGLVKFDAPYAHVLHPNGVTEQEVTYADVSEDERDAADLRKGRVKVDPFTGDYQFVIIDKVLMPDNKLPFFRKITTDLYALLKKLSISDIRTYNLERNSVLLETYPLRVTEETRELLRAKMTRIACENPEHEPRPH
jgi:KUP system potassium uptake protein